MIWTIGVYLVTGVLAIAVYSMSVSIKFAKMANGDREKYYDLIEEFLGMNSEGVFDNIRNDPLRFLFGIVIWPYRLVEAVLAVTDFCRDH